MSPGMLDSMWKDMQGSMSAENQEAAMQMARDLGSLDEMQSRIRQAATQTQRQLTELARRGDAIWRQKLASMADERRQLTKNIPAFWCFSYMMHEDVSVALSTKDLAVLEHLEDFTVRYVDDSRTNLRLEWTFRENPYFTETVLWKTLHVSEDALDQSMRAQAQDEDAEVALPEYQADASAISWTKPHTLESLEESLAVSGPDPDEAPDTAPDGTDGADGKQRSIQWSFFRLFTPATEETHRHIEFRLITALAWDLFEDPVKYYHQALASGTEAALEAQESQETTAAS